MRVIMIMNKSIYKDQKISTSEGDLYIADLYM